MITQQAITEDCLERWRTEQLSVDVRVIGQKERRWSTPRRAGPHDSATHVRRDVRLDDGQHRIIAGVEPPRPAAHPRVLVR